jgi:hypothetical protein
VHSRYLFAFFLSISLLIMGCDRSSADGRVMTTQLSSLVGTWQKATTATCSQPYPDKLELLSDQRYRGQPSPGQEFTLWDVGEYQVISDREIKISTANDAMPTYQYMLNGDRLTFLDSNSCEFDYQRLS